jgi:hypothetical protein
MNQSRGGCGCDRAAKNLRVSSESLGFFFRRSDFCWQSVRKKSLNSMPRLMTRSEQNAAGLRRYVSRDLEWLWLIVCTYGRMMGLSKECGFAQVLKECSREVSDGTGRGGRTRNADIVMADKASHQFVQVSNPTPIALIGHPQLWAFGFRVGAQEEVRLFLVPVVFIRLVCLFPPSSSRLWRRHPLPFPFLCRLLVVVLHYLFARKHSQNWATQTEHT